MSRRLDREIYLNRNCDCGSCDVCAHFRRLGTSGVIMHRRDVNRHHVKTGHPFDSVEHALHALCVARRDGAPIPSGGDHARIERISVLGPTKAGSSPGKWAEQAEHSAAAESALRHAFLAHPFAGVGLTREQCEWVTLTRYAIGMHIVDVAKAFAERFGRAPGGATTLGRIARHGRQVVYERLRAGDLVPREEAREDEMADFESRDLRGWGAIAKFLKCAERTAQDWAKDQGMPVYRFNGRVEASSEELAQWYDENTEVTRVA